MKLSKTLLIATVLTLSLQADQSAQWQQFQSQQSLKGLDCEFEDCNKKTEPKVIVKEKVVYKDRPVEKVVVKEKIVYKDRPVEKVVYRDRPVEKKQPQQAVNGRNYNKLFIDISTPADPTFLQDFIFRTSRANGLAWNVIVKKLDSAPQDHGTYSVKITGMIELPAGMNGKTLYIKPMMKNITSTFVVAEKPWKIREITINNSYTKDRAIPFYYYYKSSYYGDNNKKGFIKWMQATLPDISIMISDKEKKRGEEREYVKTKIFTTGE